MLSMFSCGSKVIVVFQVGHINLLCNLLQHTLRSFNNSFWSSNTNIGPRLGRIASIYPYLRATEEKSVDVGYNQSQNSSIEN